MGGCGGRGYVRYVGKVANSYIESEKSKYNN